MILLALVAAAAQPAETPRGFMEQLYANYRKSDYSPFTHPSQVFAPRLLSAITEDSRLAHGEVGYLDGDPVCQCQDPSGMHPRILGVRAGTHGVAVVRVSIGWDGEKPRPARFTLTRTAAGWRIADVASTDEPSLLKALESANSKARLRH
jgi:hypothetical protein